MTSNQISPVIPAHLKPPVRPGEFVSGLAAASENRIDVGVLFVGAGPAGLGGAIRLAQLLEQAPKVKEALGEVPIAVIEKGKYPGAHLVSGAVVNPVVLRKLFPDLKDGDFPFFGRVEKERVYFLTARQAFRAPFLPPTMRNHGNFVASLSRLGKWLAEKAEAAGVTILSETVGMKLLVKNGAVCGVQTDDKGRDREGNPLPNFQPGSEIIAKTTVLGEGTTGHLSQAAVEHFRLTRPNPQIYALGVKEIWEIPKPLDSVIHTMGWPLSSSKKAREFGGSFIYPMGRNMVSIGLVVGMDYADAALSVHDLLQEFKTHPLIWNILSGGKRVGWGAKAIPEGGFYSLPEPLHAPGALFVGDAAGFVNVPALKGIHYALWSGVLAAEAIFEALQNNRNPATPGVLMAYDLKIKNSFIWRDLYRVRNMRQAFGYGFFSGAALAGMMTLTGGLFPGWRFKTHLDSEHPVSFGESRDGHTYPKPDNVLTFDKLSSVYASGNRSRDSQPNHLRVTIDVPEAIGETWIHMCPAHVYEWENDGSGQKKIRINPSNCIQCGAISAKGGRLTPPEGGSGPEYTLT